MEAFDFLSENLRALVSGSNTPLDIFLHWPAYFSKYVLDVDSETAYSYSLLFIFISYPLFSLLYIYKLIKRFRKEFDSTSKNYKVFLRIFATLTFLPTLYAVLFSIFSFGGAPYPMFYGTYGVATLALFFITLGGMALPIFFVYFIACLLEKSTKKKFVDRIFLFSSIIPFYILFFSLMRSYFNFEEFANESGKGYDAFHLDTKIQSACLYWEEGEPKCPRSVEELETIYPGNFQEMRKFVQVNFVSDEAKKEYTLVIRVSPYKAYVYDNDRMNTNKRSSVFDVTTIGQDRIINPPAYDGPWTFPEWEELKK